MFNILSFVIPLVAYAHRSLMYLSHTRSRKNTSKSAGRKKRLQMCGAIFQAKRWSNYHQEIRFPYDQFVLLYQSSDCDRAGTPFEEFLVKWIDL